MENWIEEIDESLRSKVQKKLDKAIKFEDTLRIWHDFHPKGVVTPEPLKYLDDYLKCVRLSGSEFSWYRGQSKEFDILTPKLFRGNKTDSIENLLRKERDYFYEFRRRAKSLEKSIQENDFWSWYFLIQHYGGPTRLLDWTSNAAVALFMALDTGRDAQDNAVVYEMGSTVLTEYAYKELNIKNEEDGGVVLYPGRGVTDKWITNLTSESNDIPSAPISILPPYSDNRIVAQKSCFTLFGKKTNGFIENNHEITCPCCTHKVIHRIIIDGKSKESLRKELSKIGVTSETIYPGLDGLNKQIVQEIFGTKYYA